MKINDEKFNEIVFDDAPEIYRRCIKTPQELTNNSDNTKKVLELVNEYGALLQEFILSQIEFNEETQADNLEKWKSQQKIQDLLSSILSSIRKVLDFIDRASVLVDLVPNDEDKLTVENIDEVFKRYLSEINEYAELLSDWDKISWEVARTRLSVLQAEVAMEREKAEILSLEQLNSLIKDLESKRNQEPNTSGNEKAPGVFSRIAGSFFGNQKKFRDTVSEPVRFQCKKCRKISTYDRFARPKSCCGQKPVKMF